LKYNFYEDMHVIFLMQLEISHKNGEIKDEKIETSHE